MLRDIPSQVAPGCYVTSPAKGGWGLLRNIPSQELWALGPAHIFVTYHAQPPLAGEKRSKSGWGKIVTCDLV
jgi:hypothetical protein